MFLHIIDVLENANYNLAFDEYLLIDSDRNAYSAIRFWETETAVVLGYSNVLIKEVNIINCKKYNIPIFRRCSGGGTVLQGKGCINFSLLLSEKQFPFLTSIRAVNQYVMSKHRDIFSDKLLETVEVKGITDLAIQGYKFSGNAQRRKIKSALFHGTILYDYNLNLIDRYLRHPSKEPDYRQNRPHLSFIRNINISKEDSMSILLEAWKPISSTYLFSEDVIKLYTEKYSQESWIKKF